MLLALEKNKWEVFTYPIFLCSFRVDDFLGSLLFPLIWHLYIPGTLSLVLEIVSILVPIKELKQSTKQLLLIQPLSKGYGELFLMV